MEGIIVCVLTSRCDSDAVGVMLCLRSSSLCLDIFSYVVLFSVYVLSYTKMQLWWWAHQDATLMLGISTKMQLWWWGIFLFADIKSDSDARNDQVCLRASLVWFDIFSCMVFISVYFPSYGWWRELLLLLTSRCHSDAVGVTLCTLRSNSGDGRDFPFCSHEDATLTRMLWVFTKMQLWVFTKMQHIQRIGLGLRASLVCFDIFLYVV